MSRISVHNLSVTYRHGDEATPAIENISFELAQGEVLGVVGPSGCGKSTILHVLAGILTFYTGSVQIDGHKPDPSRDSIAYVPQHYALLPWKRVKDNILLPSYFGPSHPHHPDLDVIIEALELTSFLRRFPAELSGGQQQRVALARAFYQDPDLLLLDEPFSALDVRTAERTRSLYADLRSRRNLSTILVSHNMDEIIGMCDRVLLLGGSPGRILSEGPFTSASSLRDRLTQAGDLR